MCECFLIATDHNKVLSDGSTSASMYTVSNYPFIGGTIMAVSHDVGAEGNDLMSMLYADVSTSTIVQYSGAREGHMFATQASAQHPSSRP